MLPQDTDICLVQQLQCFRNAHVLKAACLLMPMQSLERLSPQQQASLCSGLQVLHEQQMFGRQELLQGRQAGLQALTAPWKPCLVCALGDMLPRQQQLQALLRLLQSPQWHQLQWMMHIRSFGLRIQIQQQQCVKQIQSFTVLGFICRSIWRMHMSA